MKYRFKSIVSSLFFIPIIFLMYCGSGEEKTDADWPDAVKRITIKSTLDGNLQDALFYVPPEEKERAVPLVVALHTWSNDYLQPNIEYYNLCKERGWIMIHPDFRGPNKTPDGCGSPKAVQDIVDAVSFVVRESNVDESRIYLAGGSGGGYMSLLMAGKHPEIWAGVSAWVPITDLTAWYHESMERGNGYADNIKASCGGVPGSTDIVDEQYRNRSPVYFLPRAGGVSIDINAGIHDGHTGSVPISHSLYAFNVLAQTNGLKEKSIDKKLIESFVHDEAVPEELRGERVGDAVYDNKVLFRREAGPVRITIFEGGHDIIYRAAFDWLSRQRKKE